MGEILVWHYKFTITFDNGKSAVIEGDFPHPQLFDIWAEGDRLAGGAKVVSVERTNLTPCGSVYDSQKYTNRPPGRLTLDADGCPICPKCGHVCNMFYATVYDLECFSCSASMYREVK